MVLNVKRCDFPFVNTAIWFLVSYMRIYYGLFVRPSNFIRIRRKQTQKCLSLLDFRTKLVTVFSIRVLNLFLAHCLYFRNHLGGSQNDHSGSQSSNVQRAVAYLTDWFMCRLHGTIYPQGPVLVVHGSDYDGNLSAWMTLVGVRNGWIWRVNVS